MGNSLVKARRRDKIVETADDGRQRKVIREIPVNTTRPLQDLHYEWYHYPWQVSIPAAILMERQEK